MQDNQEIKEIFFKFLSDSISTKDFEDLIFDNIYKIEEILSREDYFVIIDFDSNNRFLNEELKKVVIKYIDIQEYMTWKIKKDLNSIILKDDNIVDILFNFYCEQSYSFLEPLIHYGCSIGCYREEPELYSERFIKERIYEDFDKIKSEAQILLNCLEDKKIVILDQGKFEDYR